MVCRRNPLSLQDVTQAQCGPESVAQGQPLIPYRDPSAITVGWGKVKRHYKTTQGRVEKLFSKL